jgi:hypothetical protein
LYVFITRKCDLLKGSTWLVCHFLLEEMFILTRSLGHERHLSFLTSKFD